VICFCFFSWNTWIISIAGETVHRTNKGGTLSRAIFFFLNKFYKKLTNWRIKTKYSTSGVASTWLRLRSGARKHAWPANMHLWYCLAARSILDISLEVFNLQITYLCFIAHCSWKLWVTPRLRFDANITHTMNKLKLTLWQYVLSDQLDGYTVGDTPVCEPATGRGSEEFIRNFRGTISVLQWRICIPWFDESVNLLNPLWEFPKRGLHLNQSNHVRTQIIIRLYVRLPRRVDTNPACPATCTENKPQHTSEQSNEIYSYQIRKKSNKVQITVDKLS